MTLILDMVNSMTMLLQHLFDALALGSLYALGALGIGLIFGVMKLVNFAHGDYISVCVFALIVPSTAAMADPMFGNMPSWVIIPVVLAIGAGLSMLSEVLFFRHLRNSNPATMMVTSFALGFVIQHVLLMVYGSRPKALNLWPELNLPIEFMGARFPALQMLSITVTAAVLILLVLFLKRSRLGIEMRASAEDFNMARMLGVKANRVILGAFALSGLLAGAIGLILITQTGVADIRMGVPIMLVAFIASVIGGLGSLSGAVIAAFAIGIVSVLLQAWLPLEARPYRDALVYGFVIVVLVWRPQGLFVPATYKERV